LSQTFVNCALSCIYFFGPGYFVLFDGRQKNLYLLQVRDNFVALFASENEVLEITALRFSCNPEPVTALQFNFSKPKKNRMIQHMVFLCLWL